MFRLVCAILLVGAAGCAGRYVGPGSGTRDERLQHREQQRAESTTEHQRVRPAQGQKPIDNSELPVAP